MCRKAQRFEEIGSQVIFVGLGDLEATRKFVRQLKIPFPMICDKERVLFQAYGLKRMGLRDIISPSLAVKLAKTVGQGHRLGIPKGDPAQLPGVFIVDTRGRMRFAHYAKDAADHPPVEQIFDSLSLIADQCPSRN